MRFRNLARFLLSFIAPALLLASPDPQRVRRLQDSLLAPCCWAEPVSVHRSEVALEMRLEIEKFVDTGRSDREILDHFKKIHGARILIEPDGQARWWVYFIPALALVAGLALVLWLIRRLIRTGTDSSSSQTTAALSAGPDIPSTADREVS
jgi:cytochrome c-type biogenesis protein CcmH/NrfF